MTAIETDTVPFQLPITVSRDCSRSLQTQIYSQIRKLIAEGCLTVGHRVPPIRELAKMTGVSRNTVVLAYDQLIMEGYLETSRSKGTYVSQILPDRCLLSPNRRSTGNNPENRQAHRFPPSFIGHRQIVAREMRNPPEIDFWVGRPDPRSFPIKAWRKLVDKNLLHAQTNLTDYGNPAGIARFRTAICDYLGQARGFHPQSRQVIVTAGIQEALDIVARLFLRAGSTLVTECPCYKGARYIFESYGAKLIPVPVDKDGMDTHQLPQERTVLTYVTPSHQYPLGYTLSIERRQQLLEWASKYGSFILEDDYDGDFRFSNAPLPALMSMDRCGSVIYLGTFSKSMGAGIRLGYMVVPDELVEATITAKALIDNGNAWLNQAAMADYMTSGGFARHVRKIRKSYLDKRDCLIHELHTYFGEIKVTGANAGMHLVWHLPAHLPNARRIQQLAEKVGVGVYSPEGGAASVEGCNDLDDRLLLLGYSSLSRREISEGIHRLAQSLR